MKLNVDSFINFTIFIIHCIDTQSSCSYLGEIEKLYRYLSHFILIGRFIPPREKCTKALEVVDC